ncbi:MAG TPA: glycoside hydrolase family 15 protein [Trebonia sp.]
MRRDGFAPIGEYGVIGDGRSAALVAADGRVDWWAVPSMDAPPVFAAILDPAGGGTFALEPAVPYQAERRYLPGTNVLETTFRTSGGEVRVVDALNRDVDGPLPWTELAREVRGTAGEVPMRWRAAPGSRFGRARPWAWRRDGWPLLRLEDQEIAVVTDQAGEPRVGRAEVCGEFTARPGADALLALTAADRGPVPLPRPDRVRVRLRATEASWRRWSQTVEYRGPGRDLVVRSALVLKLLTYAPTRGLLAATTTSLPERIGGERNYDYRYGWVRDTSFALDTLIRLGLQHDAHGTLTWLLHAVSGTAPDIRPCYGMRGGIPDEGGELPVPGYRDSRPAHDGNQAVSQPQWGNFGDLFQVVWLAASRGLVVLDPETARMLERVADRVCDVWDKPDSGIWELGTRRHYTISKMSCWVALDRAACLAENGQLPAGDAGRWRAEAAALRDWIEAGCWSQARRSYSFYAGSDDLDAAVLLAGRMGYLPPDDPRFGQTIDAIRGELADGALLYRYTGSRQQEGAFLACSFWLADALALAGRPGEARRVFTETAARASDLGLLSEEVDPASGELLGNVPQALSHLALLMAACELASADAAAPAGSA